MSANLSNSLYLVTIVTFILALRFLSSPRRARLGNQLGAAGMLLAIVVTLAQDGLEGYVVDRDCDGDRRRRRVPSAPAA